MFSKKEKLSWLHVVVYAARLLVLFCEMFGKSLFSHLCFKVFNWPSIV
jgi:hypothetical protein